MNPEDAISMSLHSGTSDAAQSNERDQDGIEGITLLVQTAYHVGFLSTRSATPGKMVLGLSVRSVDRAGRIGVGTAFMRILLPLAIGVLSVIPLVSYLMSFVAIADLVWPIKDQRRQALHDKIAGTQVVRGKQPRATSS